MNLETIEIPVDEAKARLAEYEESLRVDRNREDEAIARGYRIAAKGLPIIRLSDSIRVGGWFDNNLPRIAVCRADAKTCEVTWDTHWQRPDALVFYSTAEPNWNRRNRGARINQNSVRVEIGPPETLPGMRRWRGRTIVPNIPPKVRPRRHRIRLFHILWEVEQWELTVPRDPALIRHVGGDLWAVHATWDLTEIERAVLAGRA